MRAGRSEELLGRLRHFGVRLGLDRIRSFLGAVGSPHLEIPVVLVAGTNGKGSTAALLAAMCRAAGYRTGLFTSPHLETVTERLAVDGQPISDRRLADHLGRFLALAEEQQCEPLTYFEVLTAAAFLHFRAARVDLAIIEVGLGGRLDATNVSEPVLSLITSIGLDHEEHLGAGLEAIAREKCGILRHGRPAIAWVEDEAVELSMRRQAAAVGAGLDFAHRRVEIERREPTTERAERALLVTGRRSYELVIHLAGRHQLRNLAVAVLAAESLSAGGWPALTAEAIAAGARRCRWPGRLEWIDLDDGRRVLLDAAHNAAGIEALVSYVAELPERPDLLFGALAEKNIDADVRRLAAVSGRVVVTRPPEDRAAAPERWLPLFERRATTVEADLARALELALARCSDLLLVTGSIYLVGAVRRLLRDRRAPDLV